MPTTIWQPVLTLLLLFLTSATTAQAHGVWVGTRYDTPQLVLGEGPKDTAYTKEMVTAIKGYDARYQPTTVTTLDRTNHVELRYPAQTAVIVTEFDYGFWSNGPHGKWINKPMNQVPGATIGTHALKYSVSYVGKMAAIKPIPGLKMQIVPAVDPTSLKKDDTLQVVVLEDGKPMGKVPLIPDVLNDHTRTVLTNAQGEANITVATNALNVIGVEVAEPLASKTAAATRNKYFAALSFTLHPQEED